MMTSLLWDFVCVCVYVCPSGLLSAVVSHDGAEKCLLWFLDLTLFSHILTSFPGSKEKAIFCL